jgi:hypothetical protein
MLSSRTTTVLRRLVLQAHHPRRISRPCVVVGRVRLFSGQPEGASSIPISTPTLSALHSIYDETEDTELRVGDGSSPSIYAEDGAGDDDDDDDDETDDDNDHLVVNNTLNEGDVSSRGLFVTGEPPLWELNEFYRDQHGITKVSTQIQTDLIQENLPLDHWAASFTCPVDTETDTGRPNAFYQAGVLRSASDEAKRHSDGRVMYLKKSTAMRAAAGSVLDVIQYQKLGIVEPRFCEEDPSLWGKQVTTDETSHGTKPTVVTLAREPVPVDTTTSQKASGKQLVSDATDESSEFIIWDIPRNNGRPPYQRIVEALSNNASASPATTSENSTKMPIPLNPEQQLLLAVDNAYAWLKQVNGLRPQAPSPHRLVLPRTETPSTLLMGKILLSAMADAIQNTAFADQSHGVEKAAKRILDVLWETKNSKPDTDAYTSFLKCLQSNSPKAVAAKAERIVFNMRTGTPANGRVLPKPNTGTINALIQLWAQVGGTSGRYENLDEDFLPDRESFLSVLSSAAYEPTTKDEKGGFDPEFARQCVQRMKELADEDPANQSLRPDTQIYNAPLRWSGGLIGRKTRPYARFIPWDNYREIFESGFRTADDDDDLMNEARSMEGWMEEMASNADDSAAPDIETYEAVIQAWVRVGSRAGLERAEFLAEKLLSDSSDCSVIPRLQTFHPILSAWMHSEDREGAIKVQQWVDRLEASSDLIPAVRPDGRILGSQITSHVSRQLLLLDELGDTPLSECDDKTRDELLVAAKACNNILEKQRVFLEQAARTGKEVDRILEVTSFAHSVIAWSNVALVNQATDQTESFEDALRQMMHAIDSFESLVATLSKAEAEKQSKQATTSSGVGLQTQQELSLQLRHMIVNAHQIYSAFVIGFRRLQSGQAATQDSPSEVQYNPFVRHIYFVERMLRRVGEFHEIEVHDLSLKMRRSEKTFLFQGEAPHENESGVGQRSITYADLFRYESSHDLRLPSRQGFLFEIASLLKESPLSLVPAGDIMRLALLIKDVENQSTARPEVETPVANLIDFVLQESIQLRRVRRPQQASISKFVQESIQSGRARSPPQGSVEVGGDDDDEDDDGGVAVSSERSTPRAARQNQRAAGGAIRRRPRRKRRVSA